MEAGGGSGAPTESEESRTGVSLQSRRYGKWPECGAKWREMTLNDSNWREQGHPAGGQQYDINAQ